MDDLFRSVRESCPPAVWSKGVELARQDAVTGDREDAGTISLRVLARDRSVSPTVILYLDDGDWQCSCGSPDDPCAHVAAAVIALKRAREQGKELPRSRAGAGKLTYRFARLGGALAFERVILHDGGETVLQAALTALTSGRVKGPPLTATADDLEVELALGSDRRGVLPGAVFPKLLKALARGGFEVTLDGAPAPVDPSPVGIVAEVQDDGPGVRLTARQDPDIKELFSNGCALCATGLRPIVLPALSPPEQRLLKEGRFFARQELAELVSTVLPGLAAKVRVDVQATSLPRLGRGERPRLELQLGRKGEQLTVTASIVYGDPVVARLSGGRLVAADGTVPVRDPDEELRLKDELRRSHGLELEHPVTLTGADAVRFVERARSFKGDVRGPGLTAFALAGPLAPRLSVQDDGFALEFAAATTAGTRRTAAPERVIAAWQAGESLVPLLSGGYAPVPTAWLARFGDRLLDLLAARDEAGKVAPAVRPALADLAEALGETPPPGLLALREALSDFTMLPQVSLPGDLTAELRSYQRDGVNWLAFLKAHGLGALLADDMGLGKTLQTIAVLAGRTLVVAPTSVIFNWQTELRRFRPSLRVCLYHGPTRSLDRTADVIVTTYALLRLDTEALAASPWDILVLDEAQALKNPDSQSARAARRVTAGFRVALSGTPVENRLDDLWSLMHLLNPGLLGDRRHFQERYGRPVAAGDAERAGALRARVKPFLLRRLKREVAPELPTRTDTVLHVELSQAERDQYDLIRAATRRDVLERLGAGGSVLEALEALLRLRQACCHPALLPGAGAAGPAADATSAGGGADDATDESNDGSMDSSTGRAAGSAKLALLVDKLDEAVSEGHKALVFSQWTSFLDLIEPALRAAGMTYLRLDGSTQDRQAVVGAFQKEGGPPVLLMSLKAGGVGLNLTAADFVFLTDPWWNPAAEDQAADRAHRIGQDRPVLVQRLVALDTVEERILALQERKRALADAALGAGGGAAAGITRDELLALLD